MREPWPPESLLVYVDRLYEAVTGRDTSLVRRLLRMQIATHLPREVREDALSTARVAADSFRAPMRLLEFRHRMIELGRDEPIPASGQLELELRARSAAVRSRANARQPGRTWRRRRAE